jgi:Family of unknown function (DUF6502)
MDVKARARVHRRRSGGDVSYSREFLERLARILVHSGHSPKELAREFREICSGLKEPARRWDPTQLAYFFDLPHVIAHWHADPQYLDSRGAPIPLPLRARGPSLCALIERVLPHEDSVAVAQALTRMRGIRRRQALYIPTGRYLTFRKSSARVHGLAALLGMLRTVQHNVSGAKTSALLERAAMNPNFPVSALPAFYRRLKPRATEFLWDTDGDMRRHEAGDARGPRTRLGVGIFAFEDPVLIFRSGHKRRTARVKRRAPRRHRGRSREGER